MKTELLFKNLFARALEDWPEEIIFGKLIRYDSPGFSIEGLYNLSEEIGKKYWDEPDEIIMRNLHYRIYGELHDLAEFCTKFIMQNLRSEKVQIAFESVIKTELDKPVDPNWGEEAVQLVMEYFAVNYPSTNITPEKIT